jgi:hypothetical protein
MSKHICSECKKPIPDGEQIWMLAPNNNQHFCSKCIAKLMPNKKETSEARQ